VEKIIAEKITRVDAFDKVTGRAVYPGDIDMASQLYMKVLFSEKVHAIVKNIDIAKALKTPGVVAIFTAKDVPNNEFGLIKPDQPVLCGPGSNNIHGNRVRCAADKVALIVAESENAAELAREQIIVDYEDLPIVTDLIAAYDDDKVLVHPEINSNTFWHNKVRSGDVEEAFKQAYVIIEGEYDTPAQEHAYLQPEAGLAYYDDDNRITVVVGGQWVHEDQEQIAHSLGIELEKIRVIYPAIGGAFGGREDMSVQIILALAIMKLKEIGIVRPVKIVWTRDESIIGHHKRHPYKIFARWGATRAGKIIAAEIKILADGGAYYSTSTKVLGNATLLCTGPYYIPNVKIDAYAVYTNNLPSGAFRGFGGPQAAFEAESQVNKLAEKLSIDPVEFRLMNTIKEGQNMPTGSPLPSGITIDAAIKECALNSGWKIDQEGRFIRETSKNSVGKIVTSTGFACGYKNIGFSFGAPENCWAKIELHGNREIDDVVLSHAGAEVGQGAHTAFILMASKALEIPVEKIRLVASDTGTSGNSGSVSASRMTFMAGNAIIGACKTALEKWKNEERPAIGEFVYRPPKTTPLEPETGQCIPNFAYGYVAESVRSVIDLETGKIEIEDVCVVNDVGEAINKNAIEGQIEGAIAQALGYAIIENFIQKKGKVITDKFSTYLIPTALDMPARVRSIILENPDPIGPFGVRGMGEMPYLPFVPALTHSLHESTGIWFDKFPLTPDFVYKKIKNG
jgi:CO/xanthine dehydrogenase Mo-binding subunit